MLTGTFGERMAAFLRSKEVLNRLVTIITGVWIVTTLLGVVEYLFEMQQRPVTSGVMEWLALSSDPWMVLTHPWTLLSYMLLHSGLWHLLFNMLMLYCAGSMCRRYMRDRRVLAIFSLSGVVGGLLFVGCYSLFPVFQGCRATLVGCSAGALGLFFAAAALNANERVCFMGLPQFQIRMIWLAVIFLAVDLLSIGNGNDGGHIAHLGGALFGWLDVRLLPVWQRMRSNRPQHSRPLRRSKLHMTKNDSNMKKEVWQMSDEEYNRSKKEQQDRVDAILDKISAKGYDSLTKEEKEFLFNYKQR